MPIDGKMGTRGGPVIANGENLNFICLNYCQFEHEKSFSYLISHRSSFHSLIAVCSTLPCLLFEVEMSQMKIYWWWRTVPSRKKTKGVGGGKQWRRTSWFTSWSRRRAKSTQVEEYSTKSCCYLFFCSPLCSFLLSMRAKGALGNRWIVTWCKVAKKKRRSEKH